jgi:hypothetical protein
MSDELNEIEEAAGLLDLDARYPWLSDLVHRANGERLNQLGDRAPARGFEFFDLTQICVQARRPGQKNPEDQLREHLASSDINLRLLAAWQVLARDSYNELLGHLATLDEYVRTGIVKRPRDFVRRKLLATQGCNTAPKATAFNYIDTITECAWGLFLANRFANIEEECTLPGDNAKDADFCVRTDARDLWIDCYSPYTNANKSLPSFEDWVLFWARAKWEDKFAGAHQAFGGFPTGIAIMLWKTRDPEEGAGGMFDALARLDFKRTFGKPVGTAPNELWIACPGLEVVWVGEPRFSSGDFGPHLVLEWRRP